MEQERNISSDGEPKEECLFSRNSHISELLELCIQPKNRKEMRIHLENFWNKFDQCFLESKYYNIFHVFGMYVLDYMYMHNGVSFSSFTKAFNAYILQVKSAYFINLLEDDDYVRNVRQYDLKNRQRLFKDPLHSCLQQGYLGLAQFLVKFGFNEFLFESDINIGKMAKIFMNYCELISDVISNALDMENFRRDAKIYVVTTYANLDMPHNLEIENRLENVVKEKFRRSVLIFYTIFIITEYKACEMLQLEPLTKVCLRKLKCLHLIIATTTEPWITFNDIENFFVTFCPSLDDTIQKCLQETFKAIYPDVSHFVNPRSLRDLSRCKVRACHLDTEMLPEQVNRLSIPISLKKFLLFDCGNIWECLKEDQMIIYLRHKNWYVQLKELRNALVRLNQLLH